MSSIQRGLAHFYALKFLFQWFHNIRQWQGRNMQILSTLFFVEHCFYCKHLIVFSQIFGSKWIKSLSFFLKDSAFHGCWLCIKSLLSLAVITCLKWQIFYLTSFIKLYFSPLPSLFWCVGLQCKSRMTVCEQLLEVDKTCMTYLGSILSAMT